MQDEGGQMVTLAASTNALGCEIDRVVVRRHMPSEAFIHSNGFSHCVITNTVRFLFQCGFRTSPAINKQSKINFTSKWLWGVPGNWFSNVPIELLPITLFEDGHVNGGIGWVENHARSVLAFKMPFAWQRHVRRQPTPCETPAWRLS